MVDWSYAAMQHPVRQRGSPTIIYNYNCFEGCEHGQANILLCPKKLPITFRAAAYPDDVDDVSKFFFFAARLATTREIGMA